MFSSTVYYLLYIPRKVLGPHHVVNKEDYMEKRKPKTMKWHQNSAGPCISHLSAKFGLNPNTGVLLDETHRNPKESQWHGHDVTKDKSISTHLSMSPLHCYIKLLQEVTNQMFAFWISLGNSPQLAGQATDCFSFCVQQTRLHPEDCCATSNLTFTCRRKIRFTCFLQEREG